MKKLSATILSFAMAAAMLTGCASNTESQANVQTAQTAVYAAASAGQGANAAAGEAEAPKYVFLFIGDGMSYPQFQAASDYLGALADDDDGILGGNVPLSFMNFPVGRLRRHLRLQLLRPRLRLHRHLHLHRPQDLLRHHQHGRDRHRGV